MGGCHVWSPLSIDCRVSELSRSETDPAVASVENRVKPLQESHAANEIHPGEYVSNVMYD